MNEIVAWIESITAGRVTALEQVTGGGRHGYRVDVARGTETLALFLQRDRAGIGPSSFMPFDRQAEVYRALEPLGIPIPHVWGADVKLNAFLVSRVPGRTWFHVPADPTEQVSVAQDFIRHLATWHRVPAAELALPSFGPVRSVREHQEDQLAGIRALFAADEARAPIDPLATLSLDFLTSRVPDYDGPAVLVQGDTGPGNFMYEHGRVTGILDWELAHLGDPMDDVAWLSWRTVQHGFPDFPARMREYEALTGTKVELGRVQYYRVNCCARLGPRFGLAEMSAGSAAPRRASGAADATDRGADGSAFIMAMLHRRMRLEALAAALGIALAPRTIAAEAELRAHAHLYDTVLDQLQAVVKQAASPSAANLAKGVARHVKYLKEIDRNGALFERMELDDIGRLLGRPVASLAEGRPALFAAARERRVPAEDYLHYHWARVVRDDHLMRLASGALYERSWPALH